MAKTLSYKSATTVTLKVVGNINIENGTISVCENEEEKEYKILDLLKDFDGSDIEISAKVKSEEDLEIPADETETVSDADFD